MTWAEEPAQRPSFRECLGALAELGPSPEQLLALHQSRQMAATAAQVSATDEDSLLPPPTKRVCAGLEVGGEGMMLGMDLKPEQTLRPTLQHDSK